MSLDDRSWITMSPKIMCINDIMYFVILFVMFPNYPEYGVIMSQVSQMINTVDAGSQFGWF